jgi:hypothetical protein
MMRVLRPIGVAILILVLSAVDFTVHNTFGWAGHIAWSEVGHFNLGKFDRQLRMALPLGTPKNAVEAYLEREGIPFKYSESLPRFYVRAPHDVRTLKIDIKLDGELKVSDIDLGIFMNK